MSGRDCFSRRAGASSPTAGRAAAVRPGRCAMKAMVLACRYARHQHPDSAPDISRAAAKSHAAPQLELSGLARWNDNQKRFIFPDGSNIWFGYCAAERDVGRYQGQEYDIIFIRRGDTAHGIPVPDLQGLPARRERLPQENVPHLQPRRRRPRVGKTALCRPAVSGR